MILNKVAKFFSFLVLPTFLVPISVNVINHQNITSVNYQTKTNNVTNGGEEAQLKYEWDNTNRYWKVKGFSNFDPDNILSVVIPSTYSDAEHVNQPIGEIGTKVFSNLENLQTVTFASNSQLKIINNDAFNGCVKIKSVDIPTSVTTIGRGAFLGCKGLASLTFGDQTLIYGGGDQAAFGYCPKLTKDNINIIPNTRGLNPKYEWVQLDNSFALMTRGSTWNKDAYPVGALMFGSVNFANTSINQISDRLVWAFSYTNLSSISFPDTMTFASTSNIKIWLQYCGNLTSVYLPNSESFSSIGGDSFRYCDKLTTINIPNSVTNVANFAFKYCSSLKNIQINSNNTKYEYITTMRENKVVGGYVFLKDSTKTFATDKVVGGLAWGYIQLVNVNNIGPSAFRYCTAITEIDFQSTITGLRDYAFADCINLKRISIAVANNVNPNGAYGAFYNCYNLNDINIYNRDDNVLVYHKTIENGNLVGGYVQRKQDTLATARTFGGLGWGKIVVPNDITKLTNYAIGYTHATTVELGDNINDITPFAFSRSTDLKEIDIPKSVTTLDLRSLEELPELKKLIFHTIPSKIYYQINTLPKLQYFEFHQDPDHGSYGERNQYIDFLRNLHINQLGTKPADDKVSYTTWFDNNTNDYNGSSYSLQTIKTSLSDGFKAWKDTHPNGLMQVNYEGNDLEHLQLTGQLDLNQSNPENRLITRVDVIKPNIEQLNLAITPKITLIDPNTNASPIIINLKPFSIELSPNNEFNVTGSSFTFSNVKHHDRTGLWISGDRYGINATINKSYFGSDWNNKENILLKANQYFFVVNNAQEKYNYRLIDKTTHTYFNELVGGFSIDIVGETASTYRLSLSLFLDDNNKFTQLKTQELWLTINNQQLFKFQTFAGHTFNPDLEEIDINTALINLNKKQRTDKVIWNTTTDNTYPALFDNSFQYYFANHYTFSLDDSGFSEHNLLSFSNFNFNPINNTFSLDLTQVQPIENTKSVNVSNLKVVLTDPNNIQVKTYDLDTFVVQIAPNNKDVDFDAKYETQDQLKLRDQNDQVVIDTTIPSTLLTNVTTDKDLIKILNFRYEDSTLWTWHQLKNNTNDDSYSYITDNGLDQFQLTYKKISTSKEVNPKTKYQIILKQLFNAKIERNNISFSVAGAVDGTLTIKTGKYIEPINPNPGDKTIYYEILVGSITGGVLLLGLLTIIIIRYKNKKRMKAQQMKLPE